MRPSLLGLSMRICEPEFALENVWHVLDVLEGSPAESAGLVPYGDWIIGWSGGVLGAESDFYDVVEAVGRPFTMTVHALILRSISTSLSVSTSTRMTLSMSYDS
jgi:golgi reassembly-stacking protein